MYIASIDMKILTSSELDELDECYFNKFGERFIRFNYGDFHRQGDKCAAQIYLETLREAIEKDKPYRIVSHRYDDFDH